VFVALFYEGVIQTYFAELVDDNRRLAHGRVIDQMVDQGGFATTQKTGHYRYWKPLIGIIDNLPHIL
jgi:hypothetical protein